MIAVLQIDSVSLPLVNDLLPLASSPRLTGFARRGPGSLWRLPLSILRDRVPTPFTPAQTLVCMVNTTHGSGQPQSSVFVSLTTCLFRRRSGSV